ncbi:hypothetical protein LSTR_LSTR011433, partial [Laodelphax striatellus]
EEEAIHSLNGLGRLTSKLQPDLSSCQRDRQRVSNATYRIRRDQRAAIVAGRNSKESRLRSSAVLNELRYEKPEIN